MFSFVGKLCSFCYKNENVRYTKCPISTHPAKGLLGSEGQCFDSTMK